jgi:hypothetical protein
MCEIIGEAFKAMRGEAMCKNVRMFFSLEENRCAMFNRVISDRNKLSVILSSMIGSSLRQSDKNGSINVSFRVLEEQVCNGSHPNSSNSSIK